MKNAITLILITAAMVACTTGKKQPVKQSNMTIYDFTMKSIDGQDVDLSKYKGQVVLLVNVASECGLTPQYKDLQAMYDKYQDKGLAILGFPANNFMGQEPGSETEIKQFCQKNYGVTFDMFSKISVKGDDIHPLYKYLTESFDTDVSWNFQKFLVDRDGNLVTYYSPRTEVTEEKVVKQIEELLAQD